MAGPAMIGESLWQRQEATDGVERVPGVSVDNDARSLVTEAIAAPAASRVPEYRDRIAGFGTTAVEPVMNAYRADPALGHFAVTVLTVVGRNGSSAAVEALHEIAATSGDPSLVKFARDAIRGLRPLPAPPPTIEDEWWPPDDAFDVPATTPRQSVLDKINSARSRRGEPVLDEAEAAQVLEGLRRRAANPRAYRNVCWHCTAVVTEEFNLHCEECNWLVCWCGACREPDRPWPPTYQAGPCPIEAGYFGQELGYPDQDYRGRSIVSANPPAPDAAELTRAIRHRGVRSLFHWTPARALESILSHGVLSRDELRRAGISVVSHGYGSLEKETALAPYVALAFRPKAVMMKAWSRNPVVLEIDPVVALGDGTLFVPGNSASAAYSAVDIVALQGAAAFGRVWPEAAPDPISQSEVWVRSRLPRRAIRRAFVETPTLADRLLARLQTTKPGYTPPLEVRPELFATGPAPVPQLVD